MGGDRVNGGPSMLQTVQVASRVLEYYIKQRARLVVSPRLSQASAAVTISASIDYCDITQSYMMFVRNPAEDIPRILEPRILEMVTLIDFIAGDDLMVQFEDIPTRSQGFQWEVSQCGVLSENGQSGMACLAIGFNVIKYAWVLIARCDFLRKEGARDAGGRMPDEYGYGGPSRLNAFAGANYYRKKTGPYWP